MKISIVIAMLVLLTSIGSAFAEDSPAMYMVVNDSEIELRLNHTEDVAGVQAQLDFDETCINLTSVNFTESPWQPLSGPGWMHFGDHIRLASIEFDGVSEGDHLIATIVVECVSENCTSDITLSDTEPVNHTTYNTTFVCESDPKDDEPCLGSCYSDINCTEIVAENISCCECVGEPGYRWQPNLDEACFGNNTPFDLCLDYCPECCDGFDNDNDTFVDFPLDEQCTCGLDPSERDPLPPVPEVGTFILVGLGVGMLLVVSCIGSIRKKLK